MHKKHERSRGLPLDHIYEDNALNFSRRRGVPPLPIGSTSPSPPGTGVASRVGKLIAPSGCFYVSIGRIGASRCEVLPAKASSRASISSSLGAPNIEHAHMHVVPAWWILQGHHEVVGQTRRRRIWRTSTTLKSEIER
jgi:hypothetical protein